MKFKEVTIFGGTGLIGKYLLQILIDDPEIDSIDFVTRRPVKINNEKVKVRIINFSNKQSIFNSIKNGCTVFSSIGTTEARVKGDNEKYRKIDFDITYNIAMACKEKNVDHFSFVSSSGADFKSNNFYLKLKGEIENSIIKLKLKSLSIIRPSLLLGKRNEKRYGEQIAQFVMPFFSFLMPPNYKPISAFQVAKAMVNISKNKKSGTNIYHYNEIKHN